MIYWLHTRAKHRKVEEIFPLFLIKFLIQNISDLENWCLSTIFQAEHEFIENDHFKKEIRKKLEK